MNKCDIDMNGKIVEQYQSGFSSSPIQLEPDEIDFLIKHDCKCCRCDKSIFNMCDFPSLLINEDEVMCEECYSENYYSYCPICEESYDTKDFTSNHFVVTEELSREAGIKAGIYNVLKRPFFYGNILTGFDGFFDDSIKIAAEININDIKKLKCGEMCNRVTSDMICSECVDKYVRKDNFIKVHGGTPILLMKKYEKEYFSEYTPEKLRLLRISTILKRIMIRGIIQKANKNEPTT